MSGVRLRQELEQVPGLGVLLAVAYVYTPAPPPATVAIVAVTPDDGVPAE
ncbi:hypothetical protein [Streptomyces justiciae]|uniref:Uncharacterized protein n=1 Tax=Streptomyces justiciae TaxID=2780140 RepID=A0ABU3LUI5_9ACTN|nr:hypothetical protein [Streptomyces justiciae]MDT7842907.1 hypothetical protein [Streptomyces justiciae]